MRPRRVIILPPLHTLRIRLIQLGRRIRYTTYPLARLVFDKIAGVLVEWAIFLDDKRRSVVPVRESVSDFIYLPLKVIALPLYL